ncbi:MAG TPA: AMP-binding protein [Baekduia sp.]|uniref:class I adenylate-forming enzyme family protein n=1 Tax=Baekduia sp. TaxID=2600305 RepID=UPI002D776907|nr:AMP-binding protein [Baekduia sp.]HET6507004.1 AMP-binding protein [Baekduia sp.]
MGELLQGKGPDLGPYGARFPLPQRTMLHVLAGRAAERPDRTWLVFDDGASLTFGGAQRAVNRVANALHADVGGPCHVGLFLRNQVEFFPAFYGAMAAGGVTVPLNADSRGVLLQRVIEKSDIEVLVARADLLDVLERLDSLGAVRLVVVAGDGPRPSSLHGVRVVSWDEWLEGRSEDPVGELPDSSRPALIQFTSGTTGNAKGVVYPHHFLYLYSAIVSDGQGHTEDDVLTTPLPLFHVAALHIVSNSALHAGCRAHLRAKFSASTFWQEIAECEATFAIILGPLAAILLRTVTEVPEHRLKKLFCLPFPADGEEFERRFGVRLLWQGYGMTEVYPHPMQNEMIEGVPYDTVGHAAAWIDYGAVDEHDRLLPPNEIGQLVYRPRLPDAMARGYYDEPQATVDAFRNFMFHTGDLGFVDEQGLVHYSGRVQDRIRRRGENVSAAELEFIAMGHESVLEAAAFGVPGEFGEHEVKLDVATADPGFDADGFHAWLKERLPRFMVPLYLEVHAELPKSASAKIQKNKLVDAGVDRPEVRTYDPRAAAPR